MDDQTTQLLTLLEQRLTTVEEITAHLFNGYVELATMVEAVIAQVAKPLEPDAVAAFAEELTTHRQEMMNMVRDVAAGLVPDPDADAPTVEDVAE